MRKFSYIILFNLCIYAIGFDGMNIPSKSAEISLSESGIASRNPVFINSAFISDDTSYLGFSINKWIQELDGSSIYFSNKNYLFTFSSIGTDNIELRDGTPSDNPLDIIGARLLRVGVSGAYPILKNINMGVGTHFNYNQQFLDKSTEFSFELGLYSSISNQLRFGMIVKNLVYNNPNIFSLYGIGLSYLIHNTMTELLVDYKYSRQYNGGIHIGLYQSIKFMDINLGYSRYSDLRTTISGGVNFNLSKISKFTYSLLSISNSNFELVHSFGIVFLF